MYLNKKYCFYAVAFFGLLWVISGKLASYKKIPNVDFPPKVLVRHVQPTERNGSVSVTGIVSPSTVLDILSQSGGKVEEVPVPDGSFVKAGDLILKIEDRDTTSALKDASVSLDEKTKLYTIDKDLSEKGHVSKVTFFDRRSELAGAEADYERAKLYQERTSVTAPYDCFVEVVYVDPGQVIQSSSLVATLFPTDFFKVKVLLSVNDAVKVRPGLTATVTMPDNSMVEGVVSKVYTMPRSDNKMYQAVIKIPVSDGAKYPFKMLKSPCHVDIKTGPKTGLEIPGSALDLSDDGVLGIKYVNDESIAVFAPVKIKEFLDDGFIIDSDLQGSINLIVRGAGFAKNGSKVEVIYSE